jgi:hypothetical protein
MSTQLSQIAKKAKLDRKARFTSLAHLLTPEFLKETWGQMNRKAAGGVDGQSAEQFGHELEMQVEAICKQLKEGIYHAPPVRRVDIPKGPGKVGTRPLGIPTVADRLLQRAVARILDAVFEADFLDSSYGFRPGRNPHHALQALRMQIVTKKVGQVFEACGHPQLLHADQSSVATQDGGASNCRPGDPGPDRKMAQRRGDARRQVTDPSLSNGLRRAPSMTCVYTFRVVSTLDWPINRAPDFARPALLVRPRLVGSSKRQSILTREAPDARVRRQSSLRRLPTRHA